MAGKRSDLLVDEIVNNVYRNSGVAKDEFFKKFQESTVPKGFLALLQPFSLKEEELKARTGLAKTSLIPHEGVPIARFSEDKLKEILVLQPPKKVVQYTSVGLSQLAEKQEASKLRRQLKPRGTKVSHRRQQVESSSNPVMASFDDGTEDGQNGSGRPAKRRRSGRSGPGSDDSDASGGAVDGDGDDNEDYDDSYMGPRLPPNFLDIVTPIYNELCNLVDIEEHDQRIRTAFLSEMSKANCKSLAGLSDFATTPSGFPVIQNHLNAGYTHKEDFAYDFKQHFSNLLQYYPADDDKVRTKAKELSVIFEARWKDALTRFN